MKKRSNVKKIYLFLVAAILVSGLFSCQSAQKNTYKDPLDLSARDANVSPAQDFFEYASGTWLKMSKYRRISQAGVLFIR